MTEIWKEIIQALGIYAVFAAALAWLLKTIVVQGLERNADQIRQETERKSQDLIERLKHDLAIEQETHKIRLAALQEKRANGIHKLYADLSSLAGTLGALKLNLPSDEKEKLKAIDSSYGAALDAFMEYRLYLSRELSERVWETINLVGGPISKYSITSLTQQIEADPGKTLTELMKLDYTKMQKQLEEIADEFRQLIGVS